MADRESVSDLILKLKDLAAAENITELDEKEAKEFLWALAALWKDPPAGDSEIVAGMLERRGLKDYVEPYYRLLSPRG